MERKSLIALGAVVLLFVVCSCSEKKFEIRGTITDAKDDTLYLEQSGLDGIVAVDSARLKSDGSFSFRHAATDAPEFYRLRIGKSIINLAVDTTETITVNAARATMATDYEVSGSDDCRKIKELALLQTKLQRQVNAIAADRSLRVSESEDSVLRTVNAYKDYVKTNYIYKAPDRTYAYFALFQTVALGGTRVAIFNPRADEDDVRAFAAVGTSWDTYHPGSLRAENLHNIAIESMRNARIIEAQQNMTIEADKVDLSGVVEISLRDNQGVVRRLSDLKGKVVLLDFCSFAQEGTTRRIMALRDVYNKFHARGLEIYQVSVDTNEHFWKTQTAALPWISVFDAQGLDSRYLVSYNVGRLPTYFLLDRNANPYKRDAQISDLEKEIEALL